ncbi:MAG: P-II family nitrogen regulator [Armatimonadetes bacterium]|nr:P-II family nitrogen regulator [Armatimonadota bacterium]
MKCIETVIRPIKLDQVKLALDGIGVAGLTVSDVVGFGGAESDYSTRRSGDFLLDLSPGIKLEMIVSDGMVEEIIETIVRHAYTGEPGDGVIFVLPADDAIRIRTGERGDEVL